MALTPLQQKAHEFQNRNQGPKPKKGLNPTQIISAFNAGFISQEERNHLFEKNGIEALPPGVNTGPTEAQVQETIDTRNDPKALDSNVDSFGVGVKQGFREIGSGAMQVALGGAELLGADFPGAQERLRTAIGQQREEFETETANNPISGGAGRLIGNVAATAPTLAAGATVKGAAIAGSAFGFLMPTEGEEAILERAINTTLGGVFGATLTAAMPVLGRWLVAGAKKTSATAAALFEQATGRKFGAQFIDDAGNLTKAGEKKLKSVGIDVEDVHKIGEGLTDEEAKALQNSFIRGLKNKSRGQIEDPASLARKVRADEFDVPLTGARVNQDFTQQQSENALRTMAGSVEAEESRAAALATQEALTKASERFIDRLGGAKTATAQDRGAIVKKGIMDIVNKSKSEIKTLYNTAKAIVGDETPLAGHNVKNAFDDGAFEIAVAPETISVVENTFARFGLIGRVAEKGKNAIGSEDIVTLANGRQIKVRGGVEPLTLGNAEKFRQALNKNSNGDQSGVVSSVIKQLDDDVDTLLLDAPAGSVGLQRQEAAEAARAARSEFGDVFENMDIVQKMTEFKTNKGFRTSTPKIAEEQVRQQIFGSTKIQNLNRLKKVLLKPGANETETAIGQKAWSEIQTLAMDDVFSRAMGQDGLSGKGLNAAVKSLGGDDVLRELLAPKQFRQFKRFQALVGDATISITGTTNASGTGQVVLNGLMNLLSVVPVLGRGANAVIKGGVDKLAEQATRKAALDSIRNKSVRKLTPKVAQQEELLASFIARFGTTLSSDVIN